MVRLILFIAFSFQAALLIAQCDCQDCSIVVPSNGSAISSMGISGAVNPTLGSNGQQVCQICLELLSDAIPEFNATIIAPDGSSIDLILETGIGVGQNISFDICFLSCDQGASPDGGFPAQFDSGAGYVDNGSYFGTYYPADGNCLEQLSGPVDGTWQLLMTDNVFADETTLLFWTIGFADDSGLGCSNPGFCVPPPPFCVAEGGELSLSPIALCQGDPGLSFSAPPSFPNGNRPPASDFDYTYIIADAATGNVIDINMTTDLTSYPPGDYQVCGLSYLINDAGLLPGPGVTLSDIQGDIDAGTYCADISDVCVDVTIFPQVIQPTIIGPIEICAGVLVEYVIGDYNPSFDYIVSITSGGFATFFVTDDIITIEWISGPGLICILVNEPCAPPESCINVDVREPEPLDIMGDFMVCPGEIRDYTFSPSPGFDQSYSVTVTDGTILSQTDESVEIEWINEESVGEICIELIDNLGGCVGEPLCVDVDIRFDYTIPDEIDGPSELCLGDQETSNVLEDPAVTEYIWTATNLIITSGEGTNEVTYEGDAEGIGTLCLEVLTDCGTMQGPICQDINLYEYPYPEIIPVTPSCDLQFSLDAQVFNNTEIIWSLIDGPGDITFAPDNAVPTSAEASDPGIYTIRLLEDNNGCQSSFEIDIEILAVPEVVDLFYDCTLENEYTVSFEVIGNVEPIRINGVEISSTSFISEVIESGSSYFFEIEDDAGCTTFVQGDYTCPCLSDAGSMPNDLLTGCIVDDVEVMAFWDQNGVLDNNDLGLYYLHNGDEDFLGDILAYNSTGIFFFDDNQMDANTIYYISYIVGNEFNGEVDIDDPCLSISNGQPVVFTYFGEIDLDSGLSTCDNTLDINGELPSNADFITWSQVSGPSTLDFSENNSIPTSVITNESGVYSIEYTYGNNFCEESYQLEINFETNPQIINVVERCNPTNDAYTISFEVTGSSPFQTSLAGSFSGNIFTTEEIATGNEYSFSVTDSTGCASSVITGKKLCDCDSNSGSMSNQIIEICGTQDSAYSTLVTGSFLDPDDIGLYVLHTSSTSVLGRVIDSNATGVFGYSAQLTLDETYYISYVVGNELNGAVDLDDACLDIAMGQPVRWNSIPDVSVSDMIETCDFMVPLSASPSNGEWTLIDNPVGAVIEIENPNSANSDFTFDTVGEYLLEWRTSGICTNQDTLRVIQHPLPDYNNLVTECAPDLASYTLSIDLLDSGAPYIINGVSANGNYTSEQLDPSVESTFTIINRFSCESTITVGPILCECMSDPGTIDSTPISLCTTELLDVNISNQDYILEDGDTLAYILHDGGATTIGNVFAISYGEPIAFDNTMQVNETYYLNAVIGESINDAINLDDVCFQFSDPAVVVWLPQVSVEVAETTANVCLGDSTFFDITVNGGYPVSLIFENEDGEQRAQTLEDEGDQLSFVATKESDVWRLMDIDEECALLQDISLEVNAQIPWTFSLVEDFEICNNPLFGATISLDDLFQDRPDNGEWNVGSLLSITGNVIDFANVSEGDYVLEFSTTSYEPFCEGSTQSIVITVVACDCPVFSNSPLEACNSDSVLELSQFDTGPYRGEWSIASPNNLYNIPAVNGLDLDILDRTAGEYELIYLIDDASYPPACDPEVIIAITLDEYLSSGEQLDPAIYCDEELNITLVDLIENEDDGGIWSIDSMILSDMVELDNLPIGQSNFTYSFLSTNSCPSSSTEIILVKIANPDFTYIADDVLCFGDDNGTIEIVIESPTSGPYTCYLNDIVQESGKIIEGLSPGMYSVYIVDENGCQSESQEIIIEEPEVITVDLGEDREVELDSEITINALVNILESDLSGIEWSDLSGILGLDSLEYRSIVSEDNTIAIQITDVNGCVALDQLSVRVILPPEEDIYVPNIFSIDDKENSFRLFNTDNVERINLFNIYDRLGNLVYSASNVLPDADEAAWDGYYNNVEAEIGVYVYMIELQLENNQERIIVGDLTLVR